MNAMHCCRLMQHITEAVLNAFRPRAMLAAPSEEHASKHQDLHAAAVSKLSQDSSILQHHALSFLTDLLSVEPAMLQYLRAQSTWELAYGRCFFFWGCDAQSGNLESHQASWQSALCHVMLVTVGTHLLFPANAPWRAVLRLHV